jgi:hypothetical protein
MHTMNVLVPTLRQTFGPCLCSSLHIAVNMFATKETLDKSKFTVSERAAVARGVEWRKSGVGYNIEHGTRLFTIGYVLLSSPFVLIAWCVYLLVFHVFTPLNQHRICEKFIE